MQGVSLTPKDVDEMELKDKASVLRLAEVVGVEVASPVLKVEMLEGFVEI